MTKKSFRVDEYAIFVAYKFEFGYALDLANGTIFEDHVTPPLNDVAYVFEMTAFEHAIGDESYSCPYVVEYAVYGPIVLTICLSPDSPSTYVYMVPSDAPITNALNPGDHDIVISTFVVTIPVCVATKLFATRNITTVEFPGDDRIDPITAKFVPSVATAVAFTFVVAFDTSLNLVKPIRDIQIVFVTAASLPLDTTSVAPDVV